MITMQQIEFSLRDLGLYLNTHPTDSAAIAEYKRLDQLRDQMLRGMGNTKVAHDQWVWVNNPWPWEYGAQGREYANQNMDATMNTRQNVPMVNGANVQHQQWNAFQPMGGAK